MGPPTALGMFLGRRCFNLFTTLALIIAAVWLLQAAPLENENGSGITDTPSRSHGPSASQAPADKEARLLSALQADPNEPKQASATLQVNLNRVIATMPPYFVGLSREYSKQTFWDKNPDGFKQLFNVLGSSPFVRIGGHSQDTLGKIPDTNFLEGLVQMHRIYNFRFIFGLPLSTGDTKLAARMKGVIEDAFASDLDAIHSFELGNEPNFWPSGVGGFVREGSREAWKPGFPAYLDYFTRTASALTGCGPGPLLGSAQEKAQRSWRLTGKIISGPAWGDFSLPTSQLAQLVSKGTCFMKESSLHWYHAGQGSTVKTLVDNAELRRANSILREHVRVSNGFGVPLRVSESNSISGGGQKLVSNTFGGALWTAEIALEYAKAGAAGIFFHDGHVGSLDNDVPAYAFIGLKFRNQDLNKPYPVVYAPFYGYLLVSKATNGNGAASFADVNVIPTSQGRCQERLKVYPLVLSSPRVLNLVILNKGKRQLCKVELQLQGRFGGGELIRLLPGPGGLLSTANGVTFAGQTYGAGTDGRMQGSYRSTQVKPRFDPRKQLSSYNFEVPAATAAMLQVPL